MVIAGRLMMKKSAADPPAPAASCLHEQISESLNFLTFVAESAKKLKGLADSFERADHR